MLRQGGARRTDRRSEQETYHADDVRARSASRVAVEADAAAAAAVGVEHGHRAPSKKPAANDQQLSVSSTALAADGENVVDDSTLLGQHWVLL